jgi:hypothetical protein
MACYRTIFPLPLIVHEVASCVKNNFCSGCKGRDPAKPSGLPEKRFFASPAPIVFLKETQGASTTHQAFPISDADSRSGIQQVFHVRNRAGSRALTTLGLPFIHRDIAVVPPCAAPLPPHCRSERSIAWLAEISFPELRSCHETCLLAFLPNTPPPLSFATFRVRVALH